MCAWNKRSNTPSQICRPDHSAHSVFVAHLNSLLTKGEEDAIIDLLKYQVKDVDAIIELSNDDWMKEPDAPIPSQVLLALEAKKRNYNLYGLKYKRSPSDEIIPRIPCPALGSGMIALPGVAVCEQTREESQHRMFRSYSWDDGHILRCFCEGDLNGIIMLFRECLEIVNHTLVIEGEDMRWSCRNHGLWTLEYTQELTSPLCITASHGYTECVRYLLHRRADPNSAPGGRSPLHDACAGGHDSCVQLLLEHGANPNHRSDDGLIPLHLCDMKSSLRCAELLLQHRALVNQTTEVMQDTPLHIAARLGLLGHVRLYLRCGADINAKNIDGETPLISACGGKCSDEDTCLQLCRLLLEKGADPEAQDQQKRRPLHHACRKSEHHLVDLLLNYDVDVSAADYNGILPLSCLLQNAELYQDKRPHLTLRALLNRGARSVCPEAFGKVLRCCSGLPEVIALLYNSYLNLQVCSKWRQDIPQDVFQAHHSFYTTFFGVSGSVRSLQHLCRFTLRKHFGSRCHLLIPLLPVPTVIKDYLLFSTEQSTCLL